MKSIHDSVVPIVLLGIAVLSFLIRSILGIPVLFGTWIRSVICFEAFGFKVSGLGPWYDGELGWPLLVGLLIVVCASIIVLFRTQDPVASYTVFVLLSIASIPTWAFPLSMFVPLALILLPIASILVLIQLFSKEQYTYSPSTKKRALWVVSLWINSLVLLDWTAVLLIGGK